MPAPSELIQPALPLPSAPLIDVSPGIMIQPPLSRCAGGPALIILVDAQSWSPPEQTTRESWPTSEHEPTCLDPAPIKKWAEESFCVALMDVNAKSPNSFEIRLEETIKKLKTIPWHDGNDKVGVISYLSEGSRNVIDEIRSRNDIAAVVVYGSLHTDTQFHKPTLYHKCGEPPMPIFKNKKNKTYYYPKVEPLFVLPGHKSFHPSSANVSHTRTLTFLKPLMGGPYFDLEEIWEEHVLYEFGERAVEKTMATMVQEPYVNHVPTLTGGIGRKSLTEFYAQHFIFNNPEDTALELVSRTVGVDRVIDEFVFSFTHDREIDWLLPGVPPTGKHCRIPFTSFVNIRGDRLFHEHIAWDQATALVQLGLLPEYLPFPYTVEGKKAKDGKHWEYRVPAAGDDTAKKLIDETSVESNQMFKFGVREVDD